MAPISLKVSLLGTFSLSTDDNTITSEINRSKRVWLLLAYLLYNRRRIVPLTELIDLLWGDETDSANPQSALKTTLHRVRSTLDILSADLGHELVIHSGAGYRINPDFDITVDTEEFDSLCNSVVANETDGGIARLSKALSMYKGDFLCNLTSSTWTVPISAYFNNLYFTTYLKLMPLLHNGERYADAVKISREALLIDPYHEEVYQHLMRNLIALGDKQDAISVYEEMSKVLLSNFGVVPSQISRDLYHEALRTDTGSFVHPGMVSEQLKETTSVKGALICDYDFFKMLYQAEARLILRSGDAVHIALFTMSGAYKKELSRRSLDYAMDNFQDHLRMSLRKGDIVSRCSPCQFIVMLPHANYENSVMVCQRLLKVFCKQYPHSPAHIDFSVQPLAPFSESGAPTI